MYEKLIKSMQDECGFIHTDESDSLLFSSLLGCVPGFDVYIDACLAFDGRWLRKPTYYSEPYAAGESKSSISRDMLLGLAWYAWFNRRLDISESVINYALEHYLVMGSGAISRIIMSPGLLATYACISHRLGGPSRSWLRWIPCDVGVTQTSYRGHLQILHCILRDIICGRAFRHRAIYDRQVRRAPRNPLYNIAAGRIAEAEEVMSDIRYFPRRRLPTNKDRKTHWFQMRDEGPDWEPQGGRVITHTGGDYLFLKFLIGLYNETVNSR